MSLHTISYLHQGQIRVATHFFSKSQYILQYIFQFRSTLYHGRAGTRAESHDTNEEFF